MKRAREDAAPGPQIKRAHGAGPEKPYEAPLPGAKLTTDDALAYLKAVKDKFRDDKVKYDEFLEVMKDFKATRIDTSGVILRVKELFKGHRNLILGFNTFLPKGFEITLPLEEESEEDVVAKKPVEFDQAINYVNKIKTRFCNNDAVYKTFLEILNMYRKGNKMITEVYKEVSTLFADHKDLLDEFTYFLPDTSSPWVMTQPYYPKAPQNAGGPKVAPNKEVPIAPQRAPPVAKRQGFPELTKPKEERKEKEVKVPVEARGPRDVGRKADKMAGHKREDGGDAKEMTAEERRAHKNANLQKELVFFEKVKARLRNKDTYQDFLKCLNLFSQEIIGRTELHSLVSDILGKFPDLMDGFNDFLARCESLEEAVKPRLEKPAAPLKDVHVARPALPAKKDFTSRPISELDLSACERCTPSYRLLPKNFPRATATYRTDLCRKVLNDDWVSVTSGSEDYSFKHMRRNQYEEALFRCEDDRYELDMLLESTSFTARKVKELEDRYAKEGDKITIDELNPVNLRCVERIYGDHGLDVLDMLRRSPSQALPVLYQRLCQKKEEWARCREDMNRVWRDVYAKNYHKSLDHRSFYFKQLDKRSLSTKGLLLEIKEVNEQKRREDENILALASGARRPLIPDYSFELPEPSVHNDLYNIIKFAADETLSDEQSAKVMSFWTSFIEPFFGVNPRVLEDSLEVSGRAKGSVLAIEGRPSEKTVAGKHSEKGEKGATEGDKSAGTSSAKSAGGPSNLGKDTQEPSTLAGLAAGATHALTANADAAAAVATTGPVSGTGAASTSPAEVFAIVTGPQEKKPDGLEASKAAVANEKGPVNQGETGGVPVGESAEKTAAPATGPSMAVNGVVAEVVRKATEELEATPSGEDERGGQAGAAGPSKALANGDRKHQEGDDMEVDGENEADADDEGEDGHGSAEESQDDSEGQEEGHFSDAEEDEADDDDDDGDDGEGGGDADEDEGSPSGPERAFAQCKALAARQIPGFESAADRNIYYGNDTFYVLFRLHQILYERVSAAKHAAREAENKWRASKDTPPPDLYAKFMQILYSLLDGQIDNSRFEDECRAMLGTSSYVLFTLDKLVFKFVKQIQSAAVDDVAQKMLSLYSYEKSKSTSAVIDLIYHANSALLLQDDTSYRFEYNTANGTFSIQMMDLGAEKLEMTAGAIEPIFHDYLSEFLQSIPDSKASRVFLTRNARRYLALPEETAFLRATANTRIYNGLECKITCQNSKVSYVLDTEDLFHRKKVAKGGAVKGGVKEQARVEKFQKWVESKISAEAAPALPAPPSPGPTSTPTPAPAPQPKLD